VIPAQEEAASANSAPPSRKRAKVNATMTKPRRGEGSIRPIARAGITKYQAYGRANGATVYVGTFDTEARALEALEDHRVLQRKIERGELPAQTDTRRTFGTAVKLWLDALERAKSRSHDEYTSRVETHMMRRFEHVPLVDITKADVIAWRDDLLAIVSAASANAHVATLSSAFTWIIDQGWAPANPCARIKRAKHIGKVFPWLQTSEAITRLLAACTDNIRSLVAVLVGTGLRLDEALHLTWDDIDLDHRIIIVHRGRKGVPKSGRVRHVPIFDSVLPVLREMKLARGENVLLWPGGRPRKPGKPHGALDQSSPRRPFKTAVERAGLPSALRLHDLRHSFASHYLADGGDLFKLSKILGHSSVRITEKTYAHLMPTAFESDYCRVKFRMPSEAAPVVQLHAV
jgi:integrase